MKIKAAEQDPVVTPRLMRRGLVAMGVAAAVYAGLWLVPNWQVERELARADTCLKRIETASAGDPHDCAPQLRFARALPWISHDGGMDRDADIARLAIRLASTRDLDRTTRDRIATQLVGVPYGANDVWTAGAFETLAARARGPANDLDLEHGVRAALWTGDAGALEMLATRSPGTSSFRLARLHLVLTCLFRRDGHDAARAAHDSAADDTINRSLGRDDVRAQWIGSDRAEVAALAQLCDPTAPPATGDRITKAGWLGLVAQRAPQQISPAVGAESRWEAIARVETLLARGDLEPAHYAVQLYSPATASSPWQILAETGDDAAPASPSRDDLASTMMRTMADRAIGEQARQLRDNSFDLALRAAAGWLRTGNAIKARASLAAASASTTKPPRAAIQGRALVPYLQLAGDLDAALATSDASLPGADDPYEADALVARAFVLIARGNLTDALDALAPLPMPGHGTDHRQMSNFALVDALWLRAALAVRLGVELPANLPAYEQHDSDTNPAFFYRAARAAPERQAEVRAMTMLPSLSDAAVLPAALYLVGRLAGTGDVEVWLDHVSATDLGDIDPIAYAAARAEAARWRDDAVAAARWEDRLAALRRLIHDDATSYLVHLLGATT